MSTKVVAGGAKGAGTGSRSTKKLKPCVNAGVVHISTTFNNVIVTVADMQGNTIAWSSSGAQGFKGTRKGTVHAAHVTATHVAGLVYARGMRHVTIRIRGIGLGREAAVKAFGKFEVFAIKFCAGVPFNGCRPPKRRRA